MRIITGVCIMEKIKPMKLIEIATDYECPYCHVIISDEIVYMFDAPFKICPCCGHEIRIEDGD